MIKRSARQTKTYLAGATLVTLGLMGCDAQGVQSAADADEAPSLQASRQELVDSINGLATINGLSTINGLATIHGQDHQRPARFEQRPAGR
ncbi:MAG: hypothetical protein JWN48_342, partial [Myxococcaceae bacterium]|nr:hypothetical protein [Myxococcaceae bacterium]